jgi:inverted formin-2
LQGNEQDEKYNEDFRKKARRITTNRRSLEADSDEKGSKLDTLPEEKSHNSSPQSADPSSKSSPKTNEPTSSYRRVYPEWKPSTSLENANIIDTMEAIEGMTCKFSPHNITFSY